MHTRRASSHACMPSSSTCHWCSHTVYESYWWLPYFGKMRIESSTDSTFRISYSSFHTLSLRRDTPVDGRSGSRCSVSVVRSIRVYSIWGAFRIHQSQYYTAQEGNAPHIHNVLAHLSSAAWRYTCLTPHRERARPRTAVRRRRHNPPAETLRAKRAGEKMRACVKV